MFDTLLEMTAQPVFGIALTLIAYILGLKINQKLKTPVANPNLIATVICISVLLVFNIPYENYQAGGGVIELFLAPATAALALKIYEQRKILKKYWLAVLSGTAVGAGVSIICVYSLCKIFGLDRELTVSLLPKSVTTAIAVPLCEQMGGIPAITVFSLIYTGMLGAVFAPVLIKLFRIKNPVESGLAIGTSTHALGTSKAVELGDIQGAMSGCAVGIAGLITVLYLLFF